MARVSTREVRVGRKMPMPAMKPMKMVNDVPGKKDKPPKFTALMKHGRAMGAIAMRSNFPKTKRRRKRRH